jgi:hypothetical protein
MARDGSRKSGVDGVGDNDDVGSRAMDLRTQGDEIQIQGLPMCGEKLLCVVR